MQKKHANNMQTTCEENEVNLGKQKHCKQNAKMQKSKETCKNNAKNMQNAAKNNMILLFFEFSRFNAESTPESALRPHNLVAVVLHFVCFFVFFIFVALLLPPSSRAPLAFAFFLHSSTRVPFVPGAFWKAPSLQTNPLIHEPQLGEFRMWLGRTPQHSKTARPKVRANITS